MNIMIQHTFQNPNMKFPDISLTFAPFQNFPDIRSDSLTIPWPWKNIFFPDFSLMRGNPAITGSVNLLAPGRFQWYLRWVIFMLILVIDDWSISCEIAIRWNVAGSYWW